MNQAIPVGHLPVLRSVLLQKVLDPRLHLGRLDEQELDDEEAHLGLAALVVPQHQAQDEPVDREHVVLPNQVVHGLDAPVHLDAVARVGELVDKVVAERPQVRREGPGTNAF